MADPTPHEVQALEAATQAVGEYIESIGRGDAFAGFDPDQFDAIVDCAVFTFTSTLAQLTGGEDRGRPETEPEREIAERVARDMALMDLSTKIVKLLEADIAGQGLGGGEHRKHIQPHLDQLRLLWKRLSGPGGFFSDEALPRIETPLGSIPAPVPPEPLGSVALPVGLGGRALRARELADLDDEIPF